MNSKCFSTFVKLIPELACSVHLFLNVFFFHFVILLQKIQKRFYILCFKLCESVK